MIKCVYGFNLIELKIISLKLLYQLLYLIIKEEILKLKRKTNCFLPLKPRKKGKKKLLSN